MTSRAIAIGGTSYPLILPNIRDPRLHVAAVIISIHVLGQVTLGFRVSVPQILAAILASAILEVAITFVQTRSFVWPASAMLTGSGVALILRVVGTPPDDPWNTYAWYVFAGGRGVLAADEVPHPVPRQPRLQPVQHRARPDVRRPRQHAGRAARLLVGADRHVGDDRGLHDHHRRRAADHEAPAPPRAGRDVLDRAGRRPRDPRRLGSLHDRELGLQPRLRLRLLARRRVLAGGDDLPVLHDHRPQDRAVGTGRAGSRSACSWRSPACS